MKKTVMILTILTSIFSTEASFAAKKKHTAKHKIAKKTVSSQSTDSKVAASEAEASTSAKSKSENSTATKLSTDVRFDDHVVGGQYQVPFEALSVVENEKSIDALIGVRKNFHDRIENSKGYR